MPKSQATKQRMLLGRDTMTLLDKLIRQISKPELAKKPDETF